MLRSEGLQALVTVAAIVAAGHAASAQEAPAPLTLESAVARALEANRELTVARLRRRVDEAAVGVARERPNPDVVYEAEKETPRQSIGATFPIELGAKRQRRVSLAEATLGVDDAEVATLELDVRTRVRRAYFALAAAGRRARLADDVRGLAVRARDAAQSRFEAGDVPRLEVLQAELALIETENTRTGAEGDVGAATAELNLLLAQPADRALALTDDFSLGRVPALDQAVTLASGSSRELAQLDRQLAEQAARRDLARALQTPDLSAGAAYTFDAQPEFSHGYRASAGLTIPLFTRHTAGVQLEDAEFGRLQAQREAVASSVGALVAAALARAAAAREQMTRAEADSLPRAAEIEQMAQDAYSAGQSGLVALLQSLQFTRDVRLRALDAAVRFQEALADLERAIGAPLP